ncbi:hypothetical protein A1O7_03781 [Cladophialophora yegresii CBS 114405]|uniref:Carbonic anhydrase n=1 Tax=Cladophialophora yegresii CBS 114405 TaxID=1182544 RepID=W9W3Q5_9EURO|nr:uncharacterized protein A1O7_03781 [Cladophialophora yegresii CBS 114405]EXJ59635.1 hypothetical protein A1O7_03781 [Cladophialophora yegresii CBS 114405]
MVSGFGQAQMLAFVPYDFKSKNEDYARYSFKLENIAPGGARSRVGIITCCDARCSPDHFFQLDENEVFVIQNGGRRTASDDVVRTLAGLEIATEIRELRAIHHTGCGGLKYADEWIKRR